MSRRIFALFLALCLILTAAPISVGAATGQQVTAGAVTVTAGNTASVTLRAENFVNLAALDVYIYYDPAIFTVSSTGNGSMLSGAQTSVNTAEAGKITLSMMSLNGISGSGNLITVYFNTGADTEPGTYPITVAIGRAYDSSLQPVTVSGVSGSVTVNKPVETQSFRVYNYMTLENNPLQKGDTLTCKIANLYGYYFVSGEFTLEYDHEMFVLESVELDSKLLGEGAVYSVNSSVLGQVRLAYANAEPVNSFYMFTVKLKVIADADTTTTVKAQASNVYRADLSPYLPDSVSGTVTLKKSPHVADHPDAFFRTEDLEVGRQNKSVFCLEAGAGVAAADFTLTYDPTVLRCVNVVMAEGLEDLGGMLVINDNYAAGTIRFSYVNMSAYDAEDLPLVEITWEPLRSPQTHYEILSGAVGIVDEKQNPITLEYVTDSGCILAPVITAPTCTEGGYTSHTCAACGNSYVDSETDSLGHTEEVIPPTAPTCTETGLTEGLKCADCGFVITAQATIPATGHNMKQTADEIAATCTTDGKKAVKTCQRDGCGYTEGGEVIPATGVHKGGTATCNAKAVCTECGKEYGKLEPSNHVEVKQVEAQASTCTVKGWDAYEYCTGCTYTTKTDLPLAAHDYNKVVTQPTCTESGYTTYTCKNCGDNYTEAGESSTGHTYSESWEWDDNKYILTLFCEKCDDEVTKNGEVTAPESQKPATCSTPGEVVYKVTVSVSGVQFPGTNTVTIPATNHANKVNKGQQDATCTEDGYTAGVYCPDCKTWLSGHEVIKSEGHKYSEAVTKAATCTEDGVKTFTCTCGDSYTEAIAKLGHELVDVEGQAATCTEPGWKKYYDCDNCDKIFSDAECKNEITDFEAWKIGDGKIDALGHNEVTLEAVAPTCTATGLTEGKHCTVCNKDTVAQTEVAALGHSYSETVVSPTFDAEGYTKHTCSVCKDTYNDNYVAALVAVAKVGDTRYQTLAAAVAAAESGATVTLMTDATGEGVVIDKNITIDFNGKTYTFNKAVGSAGTVTLGFQILKDNNVVLKNGTLTSTAVTDGKEVKVLIQNYANLTLTDMTLKDNTDYILYALSNNSGKIDVNGNTNITTDATAFDVYDFNSAGYSVPSMTVNTTGVITGKIEVSDTATLAISGGSFSVKPEATWCAKGYGPDKEAVNGYYGVHKHVAGAAVVENNVAPTCTANGKYDNVVYCTVCKDELSRNTVTVEKIAHSPAAAVEENRVESTCTVAGSYDSVVYCSACNTELSRETKALELAAHTAGSVVVENEVAATCTAEGSYDNVVYCTVCNKELSRNTVTVEKIAHTPAAAVEENRVESTCTVAGSYDEVVYCSACNTELSRETKALELAAHTEGAAVVENEVDATCTAEGSYDNVVYCSVCKAELSRNTVTVPATGHTPAAAVRENENAATCTVDGSYDEVVYCSVEGCKAEISRVAKIIKAEGHKYVDGVCSCGDKEVKVVPFDFGQNVNIRLIEPWGLRANLNVYHKKADGSRGSKLTDAEYAALDDYGVYFVRESKLGIAGATQDTLSIEDIINNNNASHLTKSSGAAYYDNDNNRFTAMFDEGLYTYEFSDSIFVLYYVVEDGVTYYAPIRERNLSEMVNAYKDDAKTYPKASERDVYAKMAQMEKDILAYRDQFEDKTPLPIMDAPTLKTNPLGQPTTHSLKFGHTTNVVLIEPWGIRFNGMVTSDDTYDDYGVVVYYDTNNRFAPGTITSPKDLLAIEDAYVFTVKNGDATVVDNGDGRERISAVYNSGLYTYQMAKTAYVMFYVQDGDNFYYGPIKERSIQAAIDSRMAVAGVPALEASVMESMKNLYASVKVYRAEYGVYD